MCPEMNESICNQHADVLQDIWQVVRLVIRRISAGVAGARQKSAVMI
jgi:hypothetical protein